MFDAFNAQDGDSVLELWAADAEWRPAFIGGGLVENVVYRGHDGILEFVRMQADTWESVRAEPVELRDLGDVVLVQVHLTAVGRESGAPVDRGTWNVFEFREGQAVTGRVYLTEEDAVAAARRAA